MNPITRLILLALCLSFIGAHAALAGDPGVGLPRSSAWVNNPDPPIISFSLRDRGPILEWAGATVTVEVLDLNGVPVVGYPAQDVWLENFGEGNFQTCLGGSVADAPTDAQGRTTIRNIVGGGHSPDFLQVVIAGVPTAANGPLPLRVVSPDINGDHSVDLIDIGLFADALIGGYDFAADLVPDGAINMPDIAELAINLGTSCP